MGFDMVLFGRPFYQTGNEKPVAFYPSNYALYCPLKYSRFYTKRFNKKKYLTIN